ncbi:dehydrogenase [Intrasporangium sp. DVR]|uniref:dehydrogenase n=1 Tax=Intrasporangium sp. DVR TaxID=3127867 RepID=UPI00313A5F67
MATKRRGAVQPSLVVDISLLSHEGDYEERVTFLGKDYRLLRLGTDGRVREVQDLVRAWSSQAQAVAITGLREVRATGEYDGDLSDVESLVEPSATVPITAGDRVRNLLQEWAIRQLQKQLPGYFNNARVVVLRGEEQARATQVIREYTDNISTTDPLLLDLLGRLESVPVVGAMASLGLWPARQLPGPVQALLRAPGPISQAFARKAAGECDVVISTHEALLAFGLEDLRGKTVITSAVSADRLAELARRDVDLVLDTTPQPFDVVIDDAVLEALLVLAGEADGLAEDAFVESIHHAGLQPRVLQPNGPRRKSRFAFVIHPLSQQYFQNVEPLRTLARVTPGFVMDGVEKAIAYIPPFTYSHVTGITSPTGAEAEGWLISVGGTPKELLSHSPEFTYAQLLAAANTAKQLGAQVMGLGAFTKVVGDAGVTVAKRAPLPVTTGNSYSASGALWAAHEALQRLGLVEVDDEGRMRGKAMVIGATGAIGSVCARLLALACDELWMVSPESAKLLALKDEIRRDHPRAGVHVTARPGAHLADMDVIVTATSGAGKRILDITQVKPGCVITDVARPLDLSAEDVAKRPDVLVVESGEIELPGDVRMKSIGLPKGVAYACLAETVVLALEGRYETFTVGRDIEWARVKEIYRLGLKHGMRLATISGVNGVFTDEQIATVRELALARRRERASAAPGPV